MKDEKDWSKATDEELIAEAKRRYPKGTSFKCFGGTTVLSSGYFKVKQGGLYNGHVYNIDDKAMKGVKGVVYNPDLIEWSQIITEPKAGDMVECSNHSDFSDCWTGFNTGGKSKEGLFIIETPSAFYDYKFIRLPKKSEVESKANEIQVMFISQGGMNLSKCFVEAIKWGQQNVNAK